MRRHGIPVKVAGVVAVIVLSLAAGLANGGSAATSADAATQGSKTFTDGSGDVQGSAADITTVVVGDDPATGTITVAVTAARYGSMPAEAFPWSRCTWTQTRTRPRELPTRVGSSMRWRALVTPAGRGGGSRAGTAAGTSMLRSPRP
jgi:hypothetical protein